MAFTYAILHQPDASLPPLSPPPSLFHTHTLVLSLSLCHSLSPLLSPRPLSPRPLSPRSLSPRSLPPRLLSLLLSLALVQVVCSAIRRTIHTATHCSALQRTATHCTAHQHSSHHYLLQSLTYCNTLQHTATHCNTLQHTLIPGGVLRDLDDDPHVLRVYYDSGPASTYVWH